MTLQLWAVAQRMLLEIIQVRRQELKRQQRSTTYPEELLRAKQYELDMEEAGTRKI